MPRRRLRDLSVVQNPPNSKETNSEQQTAIRSSNVPNTVDEPAEIQTESGGMSKTRGRTLLKDLYELNFVERVKVARNNLGQPIGLEARLLAEYLGIIARNANMLPINYESWHHMLDSNKNQALDNIKERFALEVSDNYVKKALGKKWGDHKSALKKEYFKKNISLKEKLRNVPSGMLRYQWEDAVRFWNSKKGEEKLKDKKTEYELIASSDSCVILDDIDNRIIIEVLGLESTVEQIAQHKEEAALREVDAQRKYEELQL
ncbi:hypothetical protein Gotur_008692 [Gossypium turneri]